MSDNTDVLAVIVICACILGSLAVVADFPAPKTEVYCGKEINP